MSEEVPNTWMKAKVGQICNQLRGITYGKADAVSFTFENSILVLRGGNIQDGKIVSNEDDNVYVHHTLVKEEQTLRKGDVVIVSSTGSKQLIGKAAYVTEDFPDVGFGAFLTLLRPKDMIDTSYFGYFFQTDYYRNRIRELSGGVNINNIRKEHLAQLDFPLPPLAEQKRIVAKLDAAFIHLDTIKAKLERVPEILNSFRQAVLTRAVTGKLTEDWREQNIVEEDGNEFVKRIFSEKGKWIELSNVDDLNNINSKNPFEVPETWTFGYLHWFGELARGKSKHRPRNDKRLFGGQYPFIQTGDVARSNGYISEYSVTYSEFGLKQSRLFPKGTLCITIAANIADTGILQFDACFPDSVVGFLPYNNLYNSEFAMYFLRTVQKDIEQFAPATAQKNINLQVLSEIPIPVPPAAELQEITKRVQALLSHIDSVESKYQSLKEKVPRLSEALLSKAFKGALVQQIEDENPIEIPQRASEGRKNQDDVKQQSLFKKDYDLKKVSMKEVKKSIQKATEMDIVRLIKSEFGNRLFNYEELEAILNHGSKQDYVATKKALFELFRNDKFKKKGDRIATEVDKASGSLRYKLITA
jgi:type I restriction enzyme, S subunit